MYAEANICAYILVQLNNLLYKLMHSCNLLLIKAYMKTMIEAQVWGHW